MTISSASKKKLAILAVALALGGGTLTASAGACDWNKGYGFRDSTAPAAAGYGFRGYGWRGAGLGWRGVGWRRGVWVGEEVWAAWAGEEVWAAWAAWAGEADIAAEIYIKLADGTNPARHFFQYAGRSRPLPADFCKLDF